MKTLYLYACQKACRPDSMSFGEFTSNARLILVLNGIPFLSAADTGNSKAVKNEHKSNSYLLYKITYGFTRALEQRN